MFSLRNKKKIIFDLTSIPPLIWSSAWSGKNIWKMNFFPGQGKVREISGWSGKFRKDLESQGKVREFKNKWLWQADFRKFILFKRGKDVLSHEIV